MNDINTLNTEERLQTTKQRINTACQQAGRPESSVTLIGASNVRQAHSFKHLHNTA